MSESANRDSSLQPCLRLFLSVDLSGSTRLKNVLNQQQLWTRYRGAEAVIDALRKCENGPNVDAVIAARAVLSSLEVSTVDVDWSTVVDTFYSDFHTEFRTQMEQVHDELKYQAGWPSLEIEPWKAVGDELIYVFEIKSRRQLHWSVIAFLAALRIIDGSISDRNRQHNLRLKGSAWVAGFPVRNRRVRLPGKVEAYDYLGPEVDTGFRIGKCTRPGMLVASMELAELLAEIPTALRPMTGMIVGWEILKGVWDDKHYPVIWVELPNGHRPELCRKRIDDWEVQESRFSKEWRSKDDPKPNLTELQKHIKQIRDGLPSQLGIIDPYIVGDPEIQDEIPQSHIEIRGLLEQVTAFMKEASLQDADFLADARSAGSTPNDQEIQTLVDDAISPTSQHPLPPK